MPAQIRSTNPNADIMFPIVTGCHSGTVEEKPVEKFVEEIVERAYVNPIHRNFSENY